MPVSRDSVRAAVRERLSAESAAHSERVANMAKRIAEAYGMDPDAAYIAGLLHDWARDLPPEDLVSLAHSFGVQVSEVDERIPYLLHGPVGARLVKRDFPGISQDVVDAVASHTYGAPVMSDLAKAIYIADSVEPGRTHDAAAALRAAIGALPMHELFVRTYAESLRHLVETRRPMHPQTLKTWNRIALGGAA